MHESSPLVPELNSATVHRVNQCCVELYRPLVELNAKHSHLHLLLHQQQQQQQM